jgi:hypothetical protein
VVDDVQERAVHPQPPAEGEPQRDDPDVLDAAVAEQPLQIVLGDDERGRDDHGEQAEDEQQRLAPRGAASRPRDGQEAEDPEEGALDERPREQRRERGRRLAVGVRQPHVHRRQPRLGPVAHQDEDEPHADDARVEPGGEGAMLDQFMAPA